LLIRLGFVLRPLSLGLVYISNANPACSCVYICKFQFRPIHPPSRRLSGRPPNPRATRDLLQRSAGGTGLSGVHRTVSDAPTSPKLQRSDAPEKEGDRAPDMNSDCPVAHRTVRCATRQKARLAFQECLQWLLAALGL
jgi:hypothetical protein